MSIKCSKLYTKNAYYYVYQQRELMSCNNAIILDKLIAMVSKQWKTETEKKKKKTAKGYKTMFPETAKTISFGRQLDTLLT